MGGHDSRQSAGRDCLDQVFAALGHRHRRRILSRLFERSPRDVEELLPAVEDEAERERFELEIYHSHLPKLDGAGFVEWYREREVRRGPKFDQVAPLIELFDSHGNRLPGEWP